MPSFFVTGTDTSVGKTWFTCWLVRSWCHQGHRAAALKPVSTGDRLDAELLREAAGNVLTLDEINPIHLATAAAPFVAARKEAMLPDYSAEARRIVRLRSNWTHLAVEGVGGWRVPLARNYEVREMARDLGLPVIVVARAGLGTLNHTLLTVDSIREAGLTCAGVVLNSRPEEASPDFDFIRRTNLDLLWELLLLPVFDFDGRAHASGEVPVWLGGE